jgi:hypothetical protein
MMSAQDKIAKQILGQGLTGKWSGQGHGSAEANAQDMAKILSGIGITDIRQFGKVPIYTPAETRQYYNGNEIFQPTDEEGKRSSDYYYSTPTGPMIHDGETGEIRPSMENTVVPKDAKLETSYLKPIFLGRSMTADDHELVQYQPIDKSELTFKDGKPLVKTSEKFGNKVTGEVVPNTYSERQTGNFFGGTFAGKGNTGYGVQFDGQGNPIFYTSGASSNDLVNMFQDNKLLGVAAQIGAGYFGGPIGSAALNAAMGKSPEDILKAAAMSYIGNEAGSAVSKIGGITDVLGEAGTKVASNVAKQFVGSGGKNVDPVSALLGSGVISGFMGGEGGGPNSADFEEGYFRPGGAGYSASYSGGENVFDPTFGGTMPMGPGYYDEETSKFISDPLGGMQGPLGPETGNFDPNKEWEYSLTKPGVWTSKDGEEIDLSYMPDRDTAMTGAELMKRAGAMPGGAKAGAKTGAAGAIGSALAGAAGALGAGAANALPGMAQQQTSNADLLNLLGSKPELANIKSYKELFGEDLFGGKYVPPSASGDQSEGPADYGRRDESSTASQSEAEEQLFRGGHVDDFDADALLQLLRS